MSPDRFLGREPEIAEVLAGPRDNLWLIGSRKAGKTSTLREVEKRATEKAESGYFPLVWDMDDASGVEGLQEQLVKALLGARERFESIEIDTAELRRDDVFGTLRLVARELRRQETRLLLLCDNAEALIAAHRTDPTVLRRLGRALRAAGNVRVVLASTVRLWELAEEKGVSSPFLAAFTPPLYLRYLDPKEAEELISSSQLDTELGAEICRRSGRHPWLLLLLAECYCETRDLDKAVEQLAMDERVGECFHADVESLSERERLLLESLRWSDRRDTREVADKLELDLAAASAALQRLERLGFVRRGDKGFRLSNELFHRWLQGQTKQRAEAISRSLEEPPSAKLLGLVYDELHDQARRYMYRERAGHTLQPTALVHEAYLRLSDQSRVSWQGRTHFLAMGAAMMRRILVDHARSRKRIKRGSEWQRVTLSDWLTPANELGLDPEQLLTLDRALARLANANERQARIVEMRFFGGLKVDEVAEALGVSKRTVEGDWSRAREWLSQELSKEGPSSA